MQNVYDFVGKFRKRENLQMSREQKPQAACLEETIAVHEARRKELERHQAGEKVVFCDRENFAFFNRIEEAAPEADRRLGRGLCRTRKIAQETVRLPSSVMFAHAR